MMGQRLIGMRAALGGAMALMMVSSHGRAHEAATEAPSREPAAGERPAATVLDPLSLLSGTPDIWSVSRTDAGCYLLSPRRLNSSSMAIGQHPKFGRGVFLVSFGLAVQQSSTGEAVVVRTQGHELAKSGRLVGSRLLFVSLDDTEIDSILHELGTSGALWLMIHRTWISHGGAGIAAAIAKYPTECAEAHPSPAAKQATR